MKIHSLACLVSLLSNPPRSPQGGRKRNETLTRLGLSSNALGEDAAELLGAKVLAEPMCPLAALDLTANPFAPPLPPPRLPPKQNAPAPTVGGS